MDQCSNCKFVKHTYYDGDIYLCRRYPPAIDYADDQCRSFQPEVEEDGWCGEHTKPKEGEKSWVQKLLSIGATRRGIRAADAPESQKGVDSATQR